MPPETQGPHNLKTQWLNDAEKELVKQNQKWELQKELLRNKNWKGNQFISKGTRLETKDKKERKSRQYFLALEKTGGKNRQQIAQNSN